MSIIQEIKDSFRGGTILTKLIYLNVGVFLLLHASIAILYLAGAEDLVYNILTWLAVPANLKELAMHPWTFISYMFLHRDFFHLLFNLAWLFWFGKIFLLYFDQKKLLNIYLIGGMAGAIFFVISYNLFPVLRSQSNEAIALGASAAVMAVVIAISAYVPDYTMNLIFLGPVKIIWIALVSFILSSVVDFSINTGGKIAHIGGAFLGYFFVLRYKKGSDITTWFSKIMDSIFALFKKRKKMKISYKRTVDDMEYNAMKSEKQKEMDRILDKISRSGYGSLTDDEKDSLFKLGK
jgi:membrane associated rhomboid family serine protease